MSKLTFFCCFTSQVNSYGHGGMVSSPNRTFFRAKLEQAVNQRFVHILSLAIDNNPSWMIQRTVEISSWSISTKVWDRPGSNWWPLDLQAGSHLLPDTLLTALRGPVKTHLIGKTCHVIFIYIWIQALSYGGHDKQGFMPSKEGI